MRVISRLPIATLVRHAVLAAIESMTGARFCPHAPA